MALRKLLVLVDNLISELPIGDSVDLSSITNNNFSYRIVAVASTLTIPINQQMLVVGPVEVDGILNIDGELILME